MTAKDGEAQPFWRAKTLEQMTLDEWESLCDGCGRCCLIKLEEEDTGAIHFTDIGCKLLDAKTCRCLDYERRNRRVPDCVKLTPAVVRQLSWLPVTCAYRLGRRGTGSARLAPARLGFARQRTRGWRLGPRSSSASESDLAPELWPERVVKWPNRQPRRRRENSGSAAPPRQVSRRLRRQPCLRRHARAGRATRRAGRRRERTRA